MLRRLLPTMLLLVVLLLLVMPAFAQDSTTEPIATVQATLNGTPVEATLIAPTGTPAPIDETKPFDINVVLPYLGGALVVAVLGIIGVAGAGFLLLFRSTPAAQFLSKTVLPPLGDAGVAAYENYAKLTPQTWDDNLAVQLRAEWEAYKKQMTADIQAALSSGTPPPSVN